MKSCEEHVRLTVGTWQANLIEGHDPEGNEVRALLPDVWHMAPMLYPGAVVQLLDVERDGEGLLRPRLAVLEPDYLVDITTVCQCVKPGGITPMHYLLGKFLPREDTLAIQLGNVANQFLDDAVNHTSDYRRSMQKSFKDYPLRYCTLEGVNQRFFQQCESQYANIRHAVDDMFPRFGIDTHSEAVQLEPSFVCHLLGLQGRLDLLGGDGQTIVELKSGKHDEYHSTYREEHAWQMGLYREMLHYSMGRERNQLRTLLLYSRYPLLYDIHIDQPTLCQAIAVRNGIVHIDRQLRDRPRDFLMSLTEDDFNPLRQTGPLYQNYQRPRILHFLDTLHKASPLALDYFMTMVGFVQREQFCAKVGNGRPGQEHGFARAWLCTTEEKRRDGNILSGLQLTPIRGEEGLITHLEATTTTDDGIPNFREGDGVVLYPRNSDTDLLTNQQSLRCLVEQLQPGRVLLRLAFPQRRVALLHEGGRYAIEPGHSDALFATQYRGLFALLTCPEERRRLLLGQRRPDARHDYYLLVGPPGSGKTSIALRRMVADFLRGESQGSILLMAYTNRAVDEICAMLQTLPGVSYVRLGQELACAPPYRHRLLRNVMAPCRNRSDILGLLTPVRVFCGTVASLGGQPELLRLKQFRTAILDEASQVLEPQLLPLLCAMQCRLVMIGDHKQLPAVVQQTEAESRVQSPALREMGLLNCRDSLFQRLHRQAVRLGHHDLHDMLQTQGRMHEAISRYVSHQYYGDRLHTVPLPHQTAPLPWLVCDTSDSLQSVLATQRMALFNVEDDTPHYKTNPAEARQVACIVQALHRLHQLNHLPWQPATAIGIIVPFRGQIAPIRSEMARLGIPQTDTISIDTVERYQGSQRDVVIFSTVVSQPTLLDILSAPVDTDGQLVDRRLNVALTRARLQFLLVGRLSLLAQAPDYARLIDHVSTEARRYVVEAPTT